MLTKLFVLVIEAASIVAFFGLILVGIVILSPV